jgi:NAD(P)-dependent dehydrogenase (short-subunit alcohol dehydrogenase family)
VRPPGSPGYEPTCVVAGAGPGLGFALAVRYAREGFTSYVLSRHPERLRAPISRLGRRELRIVSLECDVSSTVSIRRALATIRQRSGGCDVLIYNAYAASSGRASTLDPASLLAALHVNVAGALHFVSLMIDEMRARGGTILFTGCGLARSPAADKTSLSVSKAALRALVDCLAEEVEGEGVRVGMVTIERAMPMPLDQLEKAADLYWRFFASGDYHLKRELRFPSDGATEPSDVLEGDYR